MIINLTPHDIHIYFGTDLVRTIPHTEPYARAREVAELSGSVDGIPMYRLSYGEPENLPEFQYGVFLIVSAITAQSCPDRTDLLVTHDLVRDDKGRPIGCRGLARI